MALNTFKCNCPTPLHFKGLAHLLVVQTQECGQYVTQELNVRVVTVTADKQKYGVMLRAEPDNKVLGARLKAAFKTVLSAIKNLSDDQLTAFQQLGQMDVCGHVLGPDDLRLIYTFDQTSDDTPNHYEAYSDNSVC